MAESKSRGCFNCMGEGIMLDGTKCPQCNAPITVEVKGLPPHEDRTAEVIELGGNSNMTVDQALDLVKRAKTAKIVIIGYRSDGKFFTANSSMTNEAKMWLLEIAKFSLIEDAQNVQS